MEKMNKDLVKLWHVQINIADYWMVSFEATFLILKLYLGGLVLVQAYES